MLTALIAGIVLAAAGTSGARDQSWKPDQTMLRGLERVFVVVHYDVPDGAWSALDESQLLGVAQAQLEAAGIRPLTDEEWAREPGRPYLYLNVEGLEIAPGFRDSAYLFTIGLDLIQDVRTVRPPRTGGRAVTWTEAYSAVVPETDLRTVLEEAGRLSMDFVRAVKAAREGGA